MKRLGVMEEKDDQFTDDQFLRYVQLFQGHLDDTAIAALTSLCGLEDPPEPGDRPSLENCHPQGELHVSTC